MIHYAKRKEMMKDNIKHIFRGLCLLGLLLAAACSDDEQTPAGAGPMELKGVDAYIVGAETRAGVTTTTVAGRKEFITNDRLFLTLFKRSDNSLSSYTYTTPVEYIYTDNAGSKYWSRADETASPQKIYWSDPANLHTIFAYSCPSETFRTTKWKNRQNLPDDGTYTYYSSIGAPAASSDLPFTFADNDAVKAEDILLSYDAGVKPDYNAMLAFNHGLALVRVVASIYRFAHGANPNDSEAVVEDMTLDDMPVMYKWQQKGDEENCWRTVLLDSSDEAFIQGADGWNSSDVTWDKTRDFEMWAADPAGTGENERKTFTFYALAVPGTYDATLGFKVRYKNPLDESEYLTPAFTATHPATLFKAGYMTTINVELNHLNGKVTLGVTYEDWKYAEDRGSSVLQKHSPYFTHTDLTKVTSHNEAAATPEDATWLYTDHQDGDKIKDVDGHEGNSLADAYIIHSALQFLSFRKEIEQGGLDFLGKYLILDTHLVMQPDVNASSIIWTSIGDDAHPFCGTLYCNGDITRLKGQPVFANLGVGSHVQDLKISTLGVDGGSNPTGALASKCFGNVCGCVVTGNVTGGDYTGSVAGIVDGGTLFACSHVGNVTSTGAHAGGIAGQLTGTPSQKGTIVASYHAGVVTSTVKKGGIVGEEVIASDVNFFGCYYDNSLFASNVSNPSYVTGLSTSQMQKENFAGSRELTNTTVGLNGALHAWVEDPANGFSADKKAHYNSHYYQYIPTQYPKAY